MSSGYAIQALAEESNISEQSNADEQVVVVGSVMPKSISDIPGTVWFVDQEQIAQQYRAGKNLGDILSATIPSLDVGTGGRTNYAQNLRWACNVGYDRWGVITILTPNQSSTRRD
ncbi:hypothetical protein OGZ01_27260 [Vibrio harveyi]|nr:hypothetical protein [Vibrio harveyi]